MVKRIPFPLSLVTPSSPLALPLCLPRIDSRLFSSINNIDTYSRNIEHRENISFLHAAKEMASDRFKQFLLVKRHSLNTSGYWGRKKSVDYQSTINRGDFIANEKIEAIVASRSSSIGITLFDDDTSLFLWNLLHTTFGKKNRVKRN